MKNLLLLFFILFLSNAFSETIITCDSIHGYSHFHPNTMTKKENSGWEDDAIKNGKFSLIQVDKKFDILFSDAVGQFTSYRADGGTVELLDATPPFYNFIIYYPNKIIELFSFNLEEKYLSYSSHKFGIYPLVKLGAYVGKCQ